MIDVVPLQMCQWRHTTKICREFFQSLPQTLRIKSQHTEQSILSLINSLNIAGELRGAIAFGRNRPIGVFLVELGEDEWSLSTVAFERALYLNPKYRGGSIAENMVLETLRQLSLVPGLVSLEVGTTLKRDAPHASKLYRNLGFTEVTGSFTKEFNHV